MTFYMKTTLLIAVFGLYFLGLFAQPPTTIYAVVNGNQVSIHQVNAYHNCGFSPGLNNITMNDSVINWYQYDTLYIIYGCMCFFDYMVSIDSLNPGTYTVDVYSGYVLPSGTYPHYEGSTTFVIGAPAGCDSILKLSSSASLCHPFNSLRKPEPYEERYSVLYKSDMLIITNKGSGVIAKVVLSNLAGQEVLRKVCNTASDVQLSTSFVKKGVYIISLFDDHGAIENHKVVVF